MSLAGILARGRRGAESRMTSRVSVMRATGDFTTNADGAEVPEWATVHTDLPFRLTGGSTSDGGSRTVTVGGAEFEQATASGHMPYDTTDLADNDLIEVTSGEWDGAVFRIIEATKGDQKTARRVPIVEHPRPEEWA